MSARYFYHSPRGFSNEADIWAVEADQADEWASWFNASNPPSAPQLDPITRKLAERLLRRDGILFQTHEDDAYWLLAERKQHTINPESLRSAMRAARDFRADAESIAQDEADFYDAYPELAVAPR